MLTTPSPLIVNPGQWQIQTTIFIVTYNPSTSSFSSLSLSSREKAWTIFPRSNKTIFLSWLTAFFPPLFFFFLWFYFFLFPNSRELYIEESSVLRWQRYCWWEEVGLERPQCDPSSLRTSLRETQRICFTQVCSYFLHHTTEQGSDSYRWHCDTVDVENSNVKLLGDLNLNLWDCGGQDAYMDGYCLFLFFFKKHSFLMNLTSTVTLCLAVWYSQ